MTLLAGLVGSTLAAAVLAAPLPGRDVLRVEHPVQGAYIVRLRPALGSVAAMQGHLANMSKTEGFRPRRQYTFLAQHGFPAYAANLSAAALDAVLGREDVAYVEQDSEAWLLGTPSPRTPAGAPAQCNANQHNPHNWGISRISAQANWSGSWFPSASSPNPNYKYDETAAGSRVYAYVLDTGIQCTNADFQDELCLPGMSFVEGEGGDGDFQGHGTHCASILGGVVYGVAKKVFLQPVKVMNMYGSGTYADIMAGMDWSAAQHPGAPGVLSLSIGGSTSQALNDAVKAVVQSGRMLVAAAGNDNHDACRNSPASAEDAFTVGSVDEDDVRASSSNYGPCTDISAPGVLIQAAHRDSQSWLSGTSMACPHVAGVAAIALSENPSLTPQQVEEKILREATDGVLADIPSDTPNKLLYTGCNSSPSPPAPSPAPPPPPPPAPAPAPAPTPPTPAPPAPTPGASCDVEPARRFPCGGRTYLNEADCMNAPDDCCWSQEPITAVWCYDKRE